MTMHRRSFLLILLVLYSMATPVAAQPVAFSSRFSATVNGHTVFKIDQPDFSKSPLTGVTRRHWKDAALYLLQGAFSYVQRIEDPMQFPRQPGKSYPRNESQVPTEKLEGLCRTLFMAAPLLKEDPDLMINQIKVAEYYRHHILKLLDPSSPTYIKPQPKGGGPNQILVEFGALAVSMFYIPEILFDPLTKEQKDALAATMISYGDGKTVPSNWKFFNIFVLSFFKAHGYAVNEKLLVEYLDKSLEHYRGNGWYNDNPAYDYYSMWAFQMYGPVWAEYFGNKYYPDYAKKFMANFSEVKNNYPYLFGRDGKMIMWGRSMTYRIGSVAPLALTGLENDASVNYGWMRRISSGVLLQFLQHPEFLKDNVPTLGFYGAFEPAVQSYSCRGSAFWMGKAFVALLLPESNPFWAAVENEGPWNKELKKGQVYNKYQDSSHILITDYPNIGASEIRAWCNVKAIGANEPFRASENYNRLSYNSAFPWQADSVKGVVAMNYIFHNKKGEWEPLRLYAFKKFEQGIYYRDATVETQPGIRLQLADIPLPDGILRVDRISADTVSEMRLGHYALPVFNGKLKTEQRKVKGQHVLIIDNGIYQLAMVTVSGWENVYTAEADGVHPEATHSVVINASRRTKNNPDLPELCITLMLWKKSGENWKDKDLDLVRRFSYDAKTGSLLVQMNQRKGVPKQIRLF